MVIVGKAFRHQPDNPLPIPPRPFQNLVRRPVEVEAIDIGGFDDVTCRRARRRWSRLSGVCFVSRTRPVKWVVRLRLRLIRKRPVADQADSPPQHRRLSGWITASTVTVRGSLR